MIDALIALARLLDRVFGLIVWALEPVDRALAEVGISIPAIVLVLLLFQAIAGGCFLLLLVRVL